ncbi:hypothetical protein EGJ89_14225 [Stenotrophomonas maltophilia]|nr:hypothetical protein EGJ89_14225 [Stenotrophomonas maltophilia]
MSTLVDTVLPRAADAFVPTKVGTYQSNAEVPLRWKVSTLVDTVSPRAADTFVPTKVGTYQSNAEVPPSG